MLDRLPVLVGVGQETHRSTELDVTREPLALMETAARRAFEDAQASGLAARIDSVRVINLLSASYDDPAGALAGRLALPSGERLYTAVGGNSPQWLVNRTADDLAAGRTRAVLLAGGEALHTLRLAAKQRAGLEWIRRNAHPPMIGDNRQGSHPDEFQHGAQMPAQIYPLFEIALRAHEGRTPAAHRQHIAELSASFSRIAALHPYAWFREPRSAAEIATVTERNRMTAFPYTKYMNAIIEVDQAAAVVMTTAGEARALGIPRERWVHLHGAGDAHDIWFLKDRTDYHSSPGMAGAFAQALAQATVEPAELGSVDLYSCFPVAAQFAARILGFPTDGSRVLTVTGGLPYFGGPGNNYVMHAIATMVERLRDARDTFGLVSGLGWYMTKHAVGVYSTREPTTAWSRGDGAAAQAAIDALPHPVCVPSANGPGRLETYSVLHDREGNAHEAILIVRLDDGSRVLANAVPDAGFFAALEREEMVGAPGLVASAPDGRNRFRPAGA
jgi:acetyl-CoA C-acetyltransferase